MLPNSSPCVLIPSLRQLIVDQMNMTGLAHTTCIRFNSRAHMSFFNFLNCLKEAQWRHRNKESALERAMRSSSGLQRLARETFGTCQTDICLAKSRPCRSRSISLEIGGHYFLRNSHRIGMPQLFSQYINPTSDQALQLLNSTDKSNCLTSHQPETIPKK